MIKLNRRVTILVEGSTQNEIGSPVREVLDSWEMWAEVEDRSGSSLAPNAQQLWSYDYKVILRDERTRPIQSNYIILYKGQRLKINSLSHRSEAYKMYAECRCSTIDQNVTTP